MLQYQINNFFFFFFFFFFFYIGPKSRTERPMKTKIGTEVVNVRRDSDTTFKVKRSKVDLQGAGAYCGGHPHSLLTLYLICGLSPPPTSPNRAGVRARV